MILENPFKHAETAQKQKKEELRKPQNLNLNTENLLELRKRSLAQQEADQRKAAELLSLHLGYKEQTEKKQHITADETKHTIKDLENSLRTGAPTEREKSAQEYEKKAAEHNKNRGLLEKLMGRNKKTTEDFMRKEAQEENDYRNAWNMVVKEKDGSGFITIPDKYRNNEDIAMQAIRMDGKNINYAGKEIQNSKSAILKAMETYSQADRFITTELSKDPDFMNRVGKIKQMRRGAERK